MPTPILMPALSPTMEEGQLAKWLVGEGDVVAPGDIIAEVESDKATMEIEVETAGRIGRILVAAGSDAVAVNATIAVLLGPDEGAEAIAEADTVTDTMADTAPVGRASGRVGVEARAATTDGAAGSRALTSDEPAPNSAAADSRLASGATADDAARVFASPLARRLAAERGLTLATVAGTGPNGRIVKSDIDAAVAARAAAPRPAAPDRADAADQSDDHSADASDRSAHTEPAGTALTPARPVSVASTPSAISALSDAEVLALYDEGTYDLKPHDGMRRTIATRLTQSKTTVPHFYQTIDCRLDTVLRARERLNIASPTDERRAYKLSVNDFVIKALALALQDVPEANASWTEAGMLMHRNSDVGVAVAVEGGLYTPIIRQAEFKSLAEISNEIRDLAARARARRLAPHEYQGGTTSISNLGMYGIKSFDAVINPPHATILAVGAGIEQPVVIDGEVRVATIMSCTLSCDHRVVDGVAGAALLNAFRNYIEDPLRMLV